MGVFSGLVLIGLRALSLNALHDMASASAARNMWAASRSSRSLNEAVYSDREVISSADGELRVTLTLGEAMFSSEGLVQKVVGYNGIIGGPTLRAKPGDTLYITLVNALPVEPCNTDVPELWNQYHGADTTNLHVHGLHVPESENPNTLRINSGDSYEYIIKIPSSHQGGTHWYHPHSAGSNSMHVAGGAAGLLIIEDVEGDLPPEVADLPEVLLRMQFMDFANLQNSVVNGTRGRSYVEQCRLHCLPEEARGSCSEYFFLNGPEQGEYSPDGIIAVNGVEKPTIQLAAKQWYRVRTLFVPLGSQTIEPAILDDVCEFQLLAKDGVYLPVAPRDIRSGYMTTGSRADFLVRCDDPGTYEFRSLAEARNKDGADGSGENGSLDRILAFLEVVNEQDEQPVATTRSAIDLPKFSVATPCYLADLQAVEPDHTSYILQSGRTPEFPVGEALPNTRPEGVSFFAIAAGPNGTDEPLNIQYRGPEDPVNFTFNLGVGNIWEMDYFVPQTHPWHTHIYPFQVVSFPRMDTHNDYFQMGDWHDVLMVPNGGNETHDYGKAVLRMHLASHSGMTMAHCHDYTHVDKGMAIIVNVDGESGALSSKVTNCYNDMEDRSYRMVDSDSMSDQQSDSQSDPQSDPSIAEVTATSRSPTIGSKTAFVFVVATAAVFVL